MDRDVFSSRHGPRYHPPQKRTGEDPHHQKPSEITVEHAHKSLLVPTKPEHDTHLCSTHDTRLVVFFRHDTTTSVSSTHRRHHGVGRGQPFTDPSPDTIPHICSPLPVLTVSCPPPFKFDQDPLFQNLICI